MEDLGYLLLKNPSRTHMFELPFGNAHVFYPPSQDGRAQVAFLLDIDPVSLVRGTSDRAEGSLDQYVNDRPYAASSFLSVAMSRVFGTTMSGTSKYRQELTEVPFDLEATITSTPCRGGLSFVRELFEPLGYTVTAVHHPLDEKFPEWGESPYHTITITSHTRLQDLLTHIYVLIPVLDADKHYWVGKDEVEKLLRKGEGWLANHPKKEQIAFRYLRRDKSLARMALSRLVEEEEEDKEPEHLKEEESLEQTVRLWEQRMGAVLSALKSQNAKSVVDVGCGEGKLLPSLLNDRAFERIVGMDVSWRSLEVAARRLKLEELPPTRRKRIELIHGSLLYRDKRLAGFDAATVVEVIEHLDEPRLAAFERVLFEHAKPLTAIVTTPNSEYNVKFATLPAGQFRHKDHRFEWTRSQFQSWAARVAEQHGYAVRFAGIGENDAVVGAPTQMGVFTR